MTLMTKQTDRVFQKNKQKHHFEINICFYFESEFSGRTDGSFTAAIQNRESYLIGQ